MECLLPKNEPYFPNSAPNSPALIWVFDVNHRCSWVNQRWLDYTGCDERDIERHYWHTGMHPDDLEQALQIASAAISEHDTFNLECRQRRGDGSYGWVALTGIPRFSADGTCEGYTAYGWDIDEAKLLSQQQKEDAYFLEVLDQVNQAMQGKQDLNEMMQDTLDILLTVFDCDRAWLLDSCDPQDASWGIPMECTRPEYPGVSHLNMDIPMGDEIAGMMRVMNDVAGPVIFGEEGDCSLPPKIAKEFNFQSQLSIRITPRFSKAWVFGLHQCRSEREWTEREKRLFQEIARRLTDGLNTWLAYQDLEKSECRYREVFENSSDGIYIIDVTSDDRFKFTNFNPAAEKAYGLQQADISGQFVDEVFAHEIAGKIMANFQQCVEEKVPLGYEESLALPTGHCHFHTTLLPVQDDKGRVYRIVGMVRDLTLQKKAESELSLLNHAMNHIHEAAYLSDQHGRFLYVNQAASHMLGYQQDELLKMSVPDVVPFLAGDAWQTHTEELTRLGSLSFEGQHRCKNDDFIPVFINVTRFIREGEAYSLALVHDITERKGMEEQLTSREREFRSLAENLPDNIVRWDTQGRYLYINPSHERTLGASLNEVIGTPIPDSHAHVKAAIAEVVATGQPVRSVRQPVPVNGITELHDVNLVPEFDEGGRVVSVLGLGRDMTEIYRMQDTIAEQEQEFRSLAESVPNSIIRYDLEHRILYLNGHLVKELGLASAEEVIGRRPIEVWPDGRYNAITEAAKRAIAGGNTEVFEMVWEPEPGQTNVGQIHVVPERDVNGKIIGTIAYGHNITELRVSELRLAHFIDSLPGLAYTFRLAPDGGMCFPYISSGIEDIYGITPEVATADYNAIHNLAHPDDRQRIEMSIAESAQTMSPHAIETRICPEGEPERWLEVRAVPEAQHDGSILWYGVMLDITERKLAQQRMELLERAVDHSHDAIYLIDEQLRFAYVNVAASRVLGYGMGELLTMGPMDIDPDGNREVSLEMMRTTPAGKTLIFETQHRAKSGQVIPVEVSANHFEEEGRRFALCVVRDITERKRMEAELKEQSDFQQTLLNALCDVEMQLMMIEEGRIIHVGNRELAHEFGFTDAELDAHPMLTDIIHPDDRDRVMAYYQRRLAGDDVPNSYELQLMTRHGETRAYETAVAIVPGTDPIQVVTIGKDITERKQTEHLLKEANDFANGIINAIPDVLFEMDRDGTYLNIWTQNQEQLAAQKELLLGKTVCEIFPTEVAEEAIAAIREAEANGIAYGKVVPITQADGEVRWFEHSLARKEGDEQSGPSFIALSRDITERKKMEQQLEASTNFLTNIVDTIADPVFVKDRQHTWMLLNEAFCEFIGLPREELLGKSDFDFFPEHEAQVFWDKDEEVFTSGEANVNEETITDSDGVEHTIVTKKTTYTDANGDSYLVGLIQDITERKQIEQQLEASQNFITNIVDTIADPVFVKDRHHTWLMLNESFCQFIGRSREDMIGKNDFDFFPEHEAKIFWEKDEEVIQTGEVNINEEAFTDSDGVERTIITKKTRYIDAAGEPYLVGIILDITERKQLEERLTRREQEFRALAEHSPDTIARYDRRCRRIYANPAFAKSAGVTIEALIGITPLSQFPDSPQARAYEARIRQVMEIGVEGEFEFTWRARDREITSHIRLVPEFDQEGNIVSVLAIGRDISKIKETERQLRTLLDNQPDVIVRYDRDSRRLYVNPKYEEVNGISAEEVLGKTPMELSSKISSLSPEYLKVLDRVFESGEQAQIEMLWHERDGKDIVFDIRAIPEFGPKGDVVTVLTIGRDITEVKEVDRMKNEFVSTVSHELRTPLTSINGALGLMTGALNQEVSGQFRQMLDIAYSNSQRLTLLINDLLDMEKLVAGKMLFDMQTHDLIALVNQALVENSTYGEKYQVHYVLTRCCDASVNVDSMRLQQVLANYLSNAAKFSPSGGQVEIEVRHNDGMVRVEVIDHGPGIPKEFRERIFNKFSQADSTDTRQKGGTGLGLAISKELIERMQGRVGFESEPGRTSFYFELPMSNSVASNSEYENSMGSHHLLVVEDNHDIATVLSAMLEHNNYCVDVACDGEEALDRLAQNSYDAITLDLLLPDRNGVSLVRQIREMPETAGLPIIVVSAYTDGGRQAIEEDYPDLIWLEKPTKEEVLIAAIESVLAGTNGESKMTAAERSTKGEV